MFSFSFSLHIKILSCSNYISQHKLLSVHSLKGSFIQHTHTHTDNYLLFIGNVSDNLNNLTNIKLRNTYQVVTILSYLFNYLHLLVQIYVFNMCAS